MSRLHRLLIIAFFFLGGVMSTHAQTGKPITDIGYAKATFAGGCFWCMEPPFDKLDGVISTTS
ncbi:MAG TPA: peptide-methionine (S)-S-oxide reductase, partial [Burkholderiales bacterium]|nr:peptide-methionine (S)-S-oxide reductase [Burkholderiales bacterium]